MRDETTSRLSWQKSAGAPKRVLPRYLVADQDRDRFRLHFSCDGNMELQDQIVRLALLP